MDIVNRLRSPLATVFARRRPRITVKKKQNNHSSRKDLAIPILREPQYDLVQAQLDIPKAAVEISMYLFL